jgi:hypothetical protein
LSWLYIGCFIGGVVIQWHGRLGCLGSFCLLAVVRCFAVVRSLVVKPQCKQALLLKRECGRKSSDAAAHFFEPLL